MQIADRSELVIHLVHGTWGRGFFPRSQSDPSRRKPLWFDTGSSFTANLIAACRSAGIDPELRPLLWSGANSIRERDAAAGELCRVLAATHERKPAIPQLIVGHSHGGTVALRALHRAAIEGRAVGEVQIAALATPFIQVFSVDPGIYGGTIAKFALMLCFGLYFLFASLLHHFLSDPASAATLPLVLIATALAILVGLVGVTMIARPWFPSADRRDPIVDLAVAAACAAGTTRRSAILVLRGIDDEALLTLAAGALISKLSRFAMFLASGWGALILFWLPFAVISLLAAWTIAGAALRAAGYPTLSDLLFALSGSLDRIVDYNMAMSVLVGFLMSFATIYPAAVLSLLLLVCLAKSVFGRELALGSFRAEIPANSVPDTDGGCTVVTLPHHRAERHFIRHALYQNRQTAPTIVRWLSEFRSDVRPPS